MNKELPAITGPELISLLEKDGWKINGYTTHGKSLIKYDKKTERTLVAIIPTKSRSLPKTTLGRILSVKQTGIGRNGLLKLIEKYF